MEKVPFIFPGAGVTHISLQNGHGAAFSSTFPDFSLSKNILWPCIFRPVCPVTDSHICAGSAGIYLTDNECRWVPCGSVFRVLYLYSLTLASRDIGHHHSSSLSYLFGCMMNTQYHLQGVMPSCSDCTSVYLA